MRLVHQLCIAALGALAACTDALAGRDILLDGAFMNVSDSNYASDGQFWHASDSNAAFGTLDIPLDFGSGVVTGRRFRFDDATGRVSFVNASNVPTGEFIAPLAVVGGFNPDYQNGVWTFGELAPAYATNDFPAGPFVYDTTTTLKAYRFNWQLLCPNVDGVCTFDQLLTLQAVIIALDPEDFILEFNYRNSYSPTGGVGSFLLGSANATYGGPFIDTGPNYCFHAGVESVCGSVVTPTVPEPESLFLLAFGALTWIGLARRGRTMGTVTA